MCCHIGLGKGFDKRSHELFFERFPLFRHRGLLGKNIESHRQDQDRQKNFSHSLAPQQNVLQKKTTLRTPGFKTNWGIKNNTNYAR